MSLNPEPSPIVWVRSPDGEVVPVYLRCIVAVDPEGKPNQAGEGKAGDWIIEIPLSLFPWHEAEAFVAAAQAAGFRVIDSVIDSKQEYL